MTQDITPAETVERLVEHITAVRDEYRQARVDDLTQVELHAAQGDIGGVSEYSTSAERNGAALLACGRILTVAEDLLAALTAPAPSASVAGEAAWLIEWPATRQMPLRYWHPTEGHVIDPNHALRFARREDAELMRQHAKLQEARSVEHMWIAALPPKPDAVTVPKGIVPIDLENAAWAWLDRKFGTPNDDPVDRAYDASEMVDAFHAGCAYTPKPDAPDRVTEGEREASRAAIEAFKRAGDAFAQWMGDPEGKDDLASAYDAAGLVIEDFATTPARLLEEKEALTWFSAQHRLTLDYHCPVYGDCNDQSREWRVTLESGSINDREFDVVGRGETAAAAIIAARAALGGETR